MIRNIIRFSVILLSIMTLASCSLTSKTCPTSEIMYPSFITDIDIDTSTQLTATSKCVRLGFLSFGPKQFAENGAFSLIGADDVKGSCLYKALEGTDYDLIVGPEYKTEIKNYFIVKVYKTTVVGYGAKIKGVHKSKTLSPSGKEVIPTVTL